MPFESGFIKKLLVADRVRHLTTARQLLGHVGRAG